MTESCPFEPQLEEKERRRHFNKFLTKKGKFLINEDNATSFKLSDSEIIFDKLYPQDWTTQFCKLHRKLNFAEVQR